MPSTRGGRSEVLALVELGRLPEGGDDSVPDEVIERYEELLDRVAGGAPLTVVEASALVELFPETSCFGLEWTLLHLLEATPGWPLAEVIERCPAGEWRERLLKRSGSAAP